MESWRKVWKDGIAPQLGVNHLEVLKKALEEDDRSLIQGKTTDPPPLACHEDWEVRGACLLGYAFWKGDDLSTVQEVEEAFARACFECDSLVGEPAGCRNILNPFDDWDRETMRKNMLELVNETLRERELQENS